MHHCGACFSLEPAWAGIGLPVSTTHRVVDCGADDRALNLTLPYTRAFVGHGQIPVLLRRANLGLKVA